jgi:hypothetical protein
MVSLSFLRASNSCRRLAVSVLGYYLPFLLAGGAISAVGYGLLSTLSPTTSVAQWIGYQILYGVASGCTAAAVSLILQDTYIVC